MIIQYMKSKLSHVIENALLVPCSHVLHNDILVKDRPHIQWWTHKITTELKNPYHLVTLYLLQPSTTHYLQVCGDVGVS